MAALRWLLAILGLLLFGSAGALVVYDVYLASELRRLLKRKSEAGHATTSCRARPLPAVRWQRVALLPLPAAASMVVRDGNAGARVSQIQGARAHGWYAGLYGTDGNRG